MSVVSLRKKDAPRATTVRKATRVYAIAFDLDSATAERLCGANWRGTCYGKIQSVFAKHGFARQQGSVYFGDELSDAVRCVMAVQEADKRFAWFGPAVRDLRMLRVDENNDLMPAINNRLRLGDEGEAA